MGLWHLVAARAGRPWMFLLYLATVALFYVAFRTKPDPTTFEAYYTQYMRSDGRRKKSISAWFGRIVEKVSGAGQMPPTLVYDFLFGYLVTFPRRHSRSSSDSMGPSYFIGMFGGWFPLNLSPSDSPGGEYIPLQPAHVYPGETSPASALAAGERLEAQAITLKAQSNYGEAGRVFMELGRVLDGADPVSAAKAFEDAAKSFKMAKQTEESLRASQEAIRILQRTGRNCRVAIIYESMADSGNDNRRKVEYWRHAVKFYEAEGDRRASPLKAKIADSMASSKEYAEAAKWYGERADDLAQDELLLMAAARAEFLGQVCLLAGGQPRIKYAPSWFVPTPEHALILRLDRALKDGIEEEQMQNVKEDIRRLVGLPQWIVEAMALIDKRIESHSNDLR